MYRYAARFKGLTPTQVLVELNTLFLLPMFNNGSMEQQLKDKKEKSHNYRNIK
jgi:hypothetical protein